MRKDFGGAARALVLPTAALVAVASFYPGRLELAVRIYALVLCAAVIALALSALRRALPPVRALEAPRARTAPQPVARLGRLEDAAALGVAGAFDLHHRLRPRLRTLARGLLASRRGISLDGDPDAARAALGEETWQLVRPDRPPPEDRLARGLGVPELATVVESLERV